MTRSSLEVGIYSALISFSGGNKNRKCINIIFADFHQTMTFKTGRLILILNSLQTRYRRIFLLLLLHPFSVFITDWTTSTIISALLTLLKSWLKHKLNLCTAYGCCRAIETESNKLNELATQFWVVPLHSLFSFPAYESF